ncbi:MAG TPA: AI-2E family transporter [Anaerolineae bacterium]|nr:AI-2E family transporter [Anaerolineae bacterium]
MTVRQAFQTTVVVLATLLLAYLLYKVGQILLVLFLAIVFASAIRPVVDWLSRWHVPRGLAILMVYLLVLGIVFVSIVVATPPLIEMTTGLLSGELLREPLLRFSSWLTIFGWENFRVILPVITLPEQVQALIEQARGLAERQVWPLAMGGVLVLAQLVLVFVMTFYWLTAREPMLAFILRLSPLRQRGQVETVWNDVEHTLGAYVRGQAILMGAVGLASYLGLLILGVPYAPALAILAALTEAIPVVGPFAGAVPAVLLAFTVSWPVALFVALLYIVIQQLEAHILVPKVMERAVGLNPLLVIVALIAGGLLSGVVGALLAVPVAGALQVIVRHLLIDPTIRKRTLRTEDGLVIVGEEEEEEAEQEIAATVQVPGQPGNRPEA